MEFFRKKTNRSSGYYGDLLFPVADLPAKSPVTLWVEKDEECLMLRCEKENTEIPYLRLISFVADNEPRIRDGESRIPAETLEDLSEKSEDQFTRIQLAVRMTGARWFGELQYVDEEGQLQKIDIMERGRSGNYYIDAVKSLQAIEMEKYFREVLEL